MEVVFNSKVREENVLQTTAECLKNIQTNLSNGIRLTELYIDVEIASDVRELIEKEIENKRFEWLIVRRDNNPYTGKIQHFTSERIGDKRYYKLYYHGN